jgi:threonine synthase
VNSINCARILAQTVYYFLSYFHFRAQLPSNGDVQIQYVVPTGNFGDVLAGYYAKKMGLPIRKLVVATNSNDILARFWKTGKYEKVDSTVDVGGVVNNRKQATDASGVKETLSPAMDILVSSNFERLLWYLAFENSLGSTKEDRVKVDCTTLDLWMGQVKSNSRVEVPVSVLQTAQKEFSETFSRALEQLPNFNFDRDVLPKEFIGLLDREKRVIDVETADIDLVKAVIENVANRNLSYFKFRNIARSKRVLGND